MGTLNHHSVLINELRRHGITISVENVPAIVQAGIDNLLDRQGLELKPEDVTTLHLILHELRNENVKR